MAERLEPIREPHSRYLGGQASLAAFLRAYRRDQPFRIPDDNTGREVDGPAAAAGKRSPVTAWENILFTITCLYYTSFGQKLKGIVILLDEGG